MPQINIEAYMRGLYNSTGNTWLKETNLRNMFQSKFGTDSLKVLNPLIEKDTLCISSFEGKNIIGLSSLAHNEVRAAADILRISNAPCQNYSDSYLDKLIDQVQVNKKITLDKDQRTAVKQSVNNSMLILIGGPGTGKTCVLNFINDVHLLIDKDIQILYTAPTGRAAKRITESTGFPASTVHHRLGITENNMEPNLINSTFRILTCDEVSMLDMAVASALFKAIPTGTKLILVGDTDQLPSVGPGAVLRDLIHSQKVPVAKLTKTFRQSGESILFDNIQRIKRGESSLVSGDDFQIAVPNGKVKERDLLMYLYMREVKKYGISDVMCLTPYRQKGDTGAINMNNYIQSVINSTGNEIKGATEVFRKNDIVMQLTNEVNCVNGDIGHVTKIYNNGLRVQYSNTEADYGFSTINQLTLAYAMSIHKSQGSEAKSVVTLLLDEHKAMLQRNLLYTAVTRAKRNCTLMCTPFAIKTAINNSASDKRFTMLSERIKNLK